MKFATTILLIAGTMFIATAVLANPAGRGGKGKDYDTANFTIRKGSSVEINGTCYARAEGHGNRTMAYLWVNGQNVRNQNIDSEYANVSYTVSSNGKYEVLLQCNNRIATAVSASVSHQKSDEDVGY